MIQVATITQMVKADQMMRQNGVLYFGFRQHPIQQIACHNPFPRFASQFLKAGQPHQNRNHLMARHPYFRDLSRLDGKYG